MGEWRRVGECVGEWVREKEGGRVEEGGRVGGRVGEGEGGWESG